MLADRGFDVPRDKLQMDQTTFAGTVNVIE
jgi:hypothetical protein